MKTAFPHWISIAREVDRALIAVERQQVLRLVAKEQAHTRTRLTAQQTKEAKR